MVANGQKKYCFSTNRSLVIILHRHCQRKVRLVVIFLNTSFWKNVWATIQLETNFWCHLDFAFHVSVSLSYSTWMRISKYILLKRVHRNNIHYNTNTCACNMNACFWDLSRCLYIILLLLLLSEIWLLLNVLTRLLTHTKITEIYFKVISIKYL